jgi:tRNA pseudouridine-54 N-methylase
MAINQDDFFTSLADDLTRLSSTPVEETEEERKKREEKERLELMQKTLQQDTEAVEPKKEEEIKIPASKTEENFYNNLKNDLTQLSEEDVDYTSLDGISTTRRIQYGAAQEPTIAGSTYRLLKAGVQATFSDETFKESAQRIEKDRQEKILEEFPEFRGKKEDLTVLSGRMGVAIADPVTFFIPWVKIAKAGKLAQVSAGAAVAGTDVALREKALYGEVSAGNVGLGALLGGGSTQLGNVIASRIGINKQTDKLLTVDKDGKAIRTTLKNTDPVFVGPLPETTQKALQEVSEEAFTVSQPFITSFQDNLSTLGVKFQERDLIVSEINRINKRRETKLFEDLKDPSIKPSLPGFTTTKTIKEQKLINEIRSLNDYEKQLIKLQEEINDINLVKQPENIAVIGLHSLKKAYDAGQLKGEFGENLARAMVHEFVRPLAGATAGGLVGLAVSEGETDTAFYSAMIAGAVFGKFSKGLERSEFKVSESIKNAVLEESEKIFRRSFRSKIKPLISGTHSAKLQAEMPVLQKFGNDMLATRTVSADVGDVLGESVEELTLKSQDHYRKALFDITQDFDDDTVLAAGRIVQQHNMPTTSKHSFLEKGDLENSEAVTIATKLLSLNKSFKEYVSKTGVLFKEEDAYGMTQLLDREMVEIIGRKEAEDILVEAFRIQNKNQKLIDDEVELLSNEALVKRARLYLNNSDNVRRNEIVTAQGLEDNMFRMVKQNGKAMKDNETIIQSARFFDNERVLFDQEARAYAKKLFVQDPEYTNLRLFENTIPVTEFARRFGAKGQGLKDVIQDIRDYYSKFGDIETNASLQKLIREDIKAVSDTVNAMFKVHGMSQFGSSNESYRTLILALQTMLSTTKLLKVALPSLGDLVQVMQNGSYKAAYNSFKLQMREQGSKALKPSSALALRTARDETGKILKEPIFGRKFNNRRYNGALEKELSDFSLMATNKKQRWLVKQQQRFFEIVQLGRITRFAREFAFDAGAFRAFDLGEMAAKGKLKRARIRELSSLGLTVDNAKYLGKFKNMDEAYSDKMGKVLIERAGRRAADRDALIPQVGNRRLFAQSNNPGIKFLGSFLSWAQAKTTQTNSLIRRVEDGDAKLALMILGSMPIYASIRQLQIEMNPNKEFREDMGQPLESKENFLKFIGDSAMFSGQLLPFWLDKIISNYKYNKDDSIETLYPVIGMMQDFVSAGYGVIEGKPLTSTLKFLETAVPGVKEVTRREGVGEAIGFDASIMESAKVAEKGITPVPTFSKGGRVGYAENAGLVSKDFPVQFALENPADRINEITGLPYNQPLIRYD